MHPLPCPRLLAAFAMPALFGCFFGGGGGNGGVGDTFAGTLDTSIADCAIESTPTLELGFGRDQFNAMTGDVEVHYGSQGGQHVFLSLRSTGLDLSAVSVLEIQAEAGNTTESQFVQVGWSCTPDGKAEVVGIQFVIPDTFVRDDVTVTATVTGPDGGAATATEVVHME
ncbi:MAG: hypothetical protein H0V89_00720 [Deltaproteobacteria bacterium]|nr:hypothetical protein [Deltaproteobacteria bacterium]